ncbi:hypothetical protein HNV12_09150 [Methanococcoides sp. SA1]|nr:hypothetical protein [Methanococcoides sp. SA1]
MNNKYNVTIKGSVIFLFVAILFMMPVGAQSDPLNAGLPEHFNFDENYYNVYGGPDVVATLVGDSEVSRGDTVTLNIDLMNKGVVTGFESEIDDNIITVLEQKLQKTEMSYEAQRTTAIGVVAIMTSLDPDVKVKSGPQEAGTLVAGQSTENPIQFVIEVSNNAESGDHPMLLTLYYGYQKNVQIDGDNETDLGITNMQVGLWYDVATQNMTIPVYVEEEARFAVTNVTGMLYPNSESMLYVTYANTGNLPAKDAIVRISPADPFSTTDDQAFIGDLMPGEEYEAVFKIKVDELAVAKDYGISSEIKYEDADGHAQISDSVRIRTSVSIPVTSGGGYGTMVVGLLVVAAVIVGAVLFYRRRSESTDMGSDE